MDRGGPPRAQGAASPMATRAEGGGPPLMEMGGGVDRPLFKAETKRRRSQSGEALKRASGRRVGWAWAARARSPAPCARAPVRPCARAPVRPCGTGRGAEPQASPRGGARARPAGVGRAWRGPERSGGPVLAAKQRPAFRLPPSAFRLPPSAFRLPPSVRRLAEACGPGDACGGL